MVVHFLRHSVEASYVPVVEVEWSNETRAARRHSTVVTEIVVG